MDYEISIKSMNKRLKNELYVAKLANHMKLNTKSKLLLDRYLESINVKTKKYIKEYLLPLVHYEENKMVLELNKEIKQKSDLTEEELVLLTKLVNDKYSIGAFSGMVFNASLSNPGECPIKLVEKAIRIRKLIQDMAYS